MNLNEQVLLKNYKKIFKKYLEKAPEWAFQYNSPIPFIGNNLKEKKGF